MWGGVSEVGGDGQFSVEVLDLATRKTTDLLINLGSQNASFFLNSSNVSFEFTSNSFEFLDDGTVEGGGQGGMMLGEDLGLVANFVEDFLPSSSTEELIAFVESTGFQMKIMRWGLVLVHVVAEEERRKGELTVLESSPLKRG